VQQAKTIPSGVESAPGSGPEPAPAAEVSRTLAPAGQHLRLTQVVLRDQTDRHNELVHEQQWLLHPSDRELALAGNLFVVEDLAAGTGQVLVKQAPQPWARPRQTASDLLVTPRKGGGFELSLLSAAGSPADEWAVLEYRGGPAERTRVLHEWQRHQRPATPSHALPRFLSNTWGDRSQDSRLRADFVAAEIAAGQRLGVEVVQLDDGWQRGATANSVEAKRRGGVWEGFWNADEGFWQPHPERLPEGLAPLVALARAQGLALGLWFAPDSWQEFANWRRDAARVLELHTTLGIEHFKVDGVSAKTDLALANLHQFFAMVLAGSQGRVVFDLDITADLRPGYFGALAVGPLFVENRYTDWHNYWPHQTLRNLWQLARWIDPRRLRMEFLNNCRNDDRYPGDPLAPARHAPDALFASVMFANPLGWFEVSHLPADYVAAVAPLVRTWKAHRQALFAGLILPLGAAPDGFAWTGFISLGPDQASGYALLFRELHPAAHAALPLPLPVPADVRWELLAGQGTVTCRDGALLAHVPAPLGYVFARWHRPGGS
jgi:alpha-galactosidase